MIMKKPEPQKQMPSEEETIPLKELVNPVDNYDKLLNQYPDYEQSYIFELPQAKLL